MNNKQQHNYKNTTIGWGRTTQTKYKGNSRRVITRGWGKGEQTKIDRDAVVVHGARVPAGFQ